MRCTDDRAQPRRQDRQFGDVQIERPQRILDRRYDHARRADRAAFRRALDAERVERRGRFHVMDIDARHDVGGRQQIIRESPGQRLAGLVEPHQLEQGRADAMDDAAADLALDHHRIDHAAAIMNHDVAENFDRAGNRD